MQLERLEILDLRFPHPYPHLLGRRSLRDADPVEIAEIVLGAEAFRDLVAVLRARQRDYPVQAVNPRLGFGGGGFRDHIPPLLELPKAVRLCFEAGGRSAVEPLIFDFYGLAVAHRLHNRSEVLFARRHVLEEKAVPHPAAFVQEVVQGQRGEHPPAHPVALDVLAVREVIAQPPVALYLQSEDVKDGVDVVVKSPLGDLILPVFVYRAAVPQVVDLPAGDVPVPADDIYEPDVALEVVLCHIFLS